MRHTLDFGPKSEATLKQLAKRLDVSEGEAILQAVATLATIAEKVEKGDTLMFKSADGSFHEFAA